MEVRIPESVTIVELETAPFKTVHEAADWARGHGVVGLMSSVDTGGKGEISISMMSIGKMLSGSAMHKSVTPAIHLSALVRLRDIIRGSNIEVLKGIAAPVSLPSDKTSIDVGILLNGVCDVNGVPLLPS